MVGEEMAMMMYAGWYKKDVAPHLTKKQKEKLLKKISEMSLQRPIYEAGMEFDKKDFPELLPYAHTEKINGLQLYAVMTELFEEFYPKMIPKPYPEFPTAKKKLKEVV